VEPDIRVLEEVAEVAFAALQSFQLIAKFILSAAGPQRILQGDLQMRPLQGLFQNCHVAEQFRDLDAGR
jgi:hypothetical protein